MEEYKIMQKGPKDLRNGSIDSLRLLLAFVVVINHTCIFGQYVQDIIDCAVPVFLMISGYFFQPKSVKEEYDSYIKNIRKLTPIILGALLLYLSWDLLKYLAWGIITHYSITTLWTCTNLFCPPLWYIQSFLYMNVILLSIIKISQKIGCNIALCLVPLRYLLLFAICLWLCLKGILQDSPFGWNIILCFVFFIFGFCIRKCSIDKLNLPWIALGGVISIASSVMFRYIGLIDSGGLSVAYHMPTVAFSVILFISALKIKISPYNLLSRIGRVYSLYIYIVHWIFIEFYTIGIWGKLPVFSRPLIVLIASLSLSMLYVYSTRYLQSIKSKFCK